MIKNLLPIFTTLLLLNLYLPLHAQDNEERREIVGKILAISDSIPVAYADVYVIDSDEMTATSMYGIFKLKVKPSDIVKVSAIGYQNDTILGADLINRKNQNLHYLNTAIFQIDQIDVTKTIDLRIGEKDETPVNMRSNGFGKEASIIEHVLNPVGSLYSLSKTEKRKKEVREFFEYNNTWKDFNYKVTPEKIKRITGATPEQFDKFILLFNTQHKLAPSATESEISERIDYIWKAFISMEEAKKRGDKVVEIKADEKKSKRDKRKEKKGKL